MRYQDGQVGAVCADADPSVDWLLRHGRCCALAVALKECPHKVWPLPLQARLVQTAAQLAVADRVSARQRMRLTSQ